MTTPITCDAFGDRLADFLERDVDETIRASMEAHALGCADCGALLADLRKLRIDAANLQELAPARDLWSGIAARIETPVVELNRGPSGAAAARAQRPMHRVRYGVAAAALIAVTATITHELTKRGAVASVPVQTVAAVPTTAPAPSADTASRADTTTPRATSRTAQALGARPQAPTAALAALAANHLTAQQTYDREIARLRAIVDARRSKLDTSTVRVIEHNLAVIDDAIAQCKAALKKDPASRYLMESLDDALDTKVQLLRTAAMLPSRT
ncbi:MAG TPA: hypothetical protein VHB25_17745 [Gemmatimonadaceae bacterium]|nr:hypothetical protein [Gemmatimonadaceae bacterium]